MESEKDRKQQLELNGGCFCGKVRYSGIIKDKTNIIDIPNYKCNCTICVKYRFWEVRVDPELMTITKGKENGGPLKEYKFEPFHTIHYFCNECGTHPFGLSHINQLNKPFYFVNVPTIDGITPETMDQLCQKTIYLDGLNDDFAHEPKHRNYL
ncbi:hypothetical protein ACTFIZ_007336 [Dictyostelium cf. discoideum]